MIYPKCGKNFDGNVLKKEIFEMFYKVTEIVIYTTKHDGVESYEIDLISLILKLDTFSVRNITRIVIKANRFEWEHEKPSWLYYSYKMIKQKKKVICERYNIKLLETKDHEGLLQDCLVITR